MTDLMAADFELPDGLLQYKFGRCLALATSMTVTTIVSVEQETMSETEGKHGPMVALQQ